jgi:triphosphatase
VLLLRSLALLTAEAAAAPAASEPATLADAAPAALAPLWKQVRRGARAFAGADTAARHQLRKRLKRLRYVLEPLAPLLRRRPGAALLKALRRALQSLGELNDLATAEAAFRTRAEAEPALWFVVGWLRARHDALLPRAGADLAALAALKLRWRWR